MKKKSDLLGLTFLLISAEHNAIFLEISDFFLQEMAITLGIIDFIGFREKLQDLIFSSKMIKKQFLAELLSNIRKFAKLLMNSDLKFLRYF